VIDTLIAVAIFLVPFIFLAALLEEGK